MINSACFRYPRKLHVLQRALLSQSLLRLSQLYVVLIPATYFELLALSKLMEICHINQQGKDTHCSCSKAPKLFGVLSVTTPLFSPLRPCQKQSPGEMGDSQQQQTCRCVAFQGDTRSTINCHPTQLGQKSDWQGMQKDALKSGDMCSLISRLNFTL